MKKIEFRIQEYHYTPELKIMIYDRDTKELVEEGMMTLVEQIDIENLFTYDFINYNPNKSYIVSIIDTQIEEILKTFSIEEDREFSGLAD
jgi:hypothetical protein